MGIRVLDMLNFPILLSVGYALDHAIYLINGGYLPGTFVGGVESPLSSLVYNACSRSDEMSYSGRYVPFCKESDGYLLGEGSAMFAIETYAAASKRSHPALSKINGLGIAHSLSVSIQNCLNDAEVKPEDVDCIFLAAYGSPRLDAQEMCELEKVFSSCNNLYLTTTKPLYGHLLGTEFSIEMLVAIEALKHQKIPCALFSEHELLTPNFGKLVVDHAIEARLNLVLVYAFNPQGGSISVLLGKV